MDERLLNKQEVCARLRCSLPTLDRMIRRGDLPVVRVGRRVLLRESTVNKWIRNHEHGPDKGEGSDEGQVSTTSRQ
jgi:excisionase family DNA binding protein